MTTRTVPGRLYTYDSVLKLDNVRSEHYKTIFTCVANNSYGTDTHQIRLVPPGKPDPPSEVDIVATTANSVTLSWIPGKQETKINKQ